MSKEINNREYRQQVLRELIEDLHAGHGVEEVKAKFARVFEGVSAEEIAEAEQALVDSGLPVQEIQRLCDVHAAVFKGSIQEIHAAEKTMDLSKAGHPVHTLKEENKALLGVINSAKTHMESLRQNNTPEILSQVYESLKSLSMVDLHYIKKENLLFPYLEKYGVTAPPKVMWGVDDEIRELIKKASIATAQYRGDINELQQQVDAALDKVSEMIYKEENIMLPMLIDSLAQEEWEAIAREERGLGYCLIQSPPEWAPGAKAKQPEKSGRDTLELPTGQLRFKEIIRMLDTLPVDITFVDKDDTVKYFSNGGERIFPRTTAIIGRKVTNCHPPASVHIVQGIVDDFKSGKKSHEDFWLQIGGKFVYIRYFAVRDEDGSYLGTMEVTQDIAPVQAISGEKRLVE